jgi:hypothetical protein
MVKDLFGNEHEHFRIINSDYKRIVTVEDLDTHENWVVFKGDAGMEVIEKNTHENFANPKRFDLKESQKLKYSAKEAENHALALLKIGGKQ